MKKIFLFLISILLSFSSFSQNNEGYSKLIRYDGDDLVRTDIISAITLDTVSSHLFFAINTIALIDSNTLKKSSVIYKTDKNINVISAQLDTIKNAQSSYDHVLISNDGQHLFWLGGTYREFHDTLSALQNDFLLTKTDKDLNVIWRKKYENPDILNAYTSNLVENEDGTLAFVGTKWNDRGASPVQLPSISFVLLDSLGEIIRTKDYGEGLYDNTKGVLKSKNGGYIFTGFSMSWGSSDALRGFNLKINENEQFEWLTQFGSNSYRNEIWASKMDKLNNFHYNIGAITLSPLTLGVGYINKIDSNGNVLWENNYGPNPADGYVFQAISTGQQEDLMVSGTHYGDNFTKGWFAKIDPNGNEVWSRSINYDSTINIHESLFQMIDLHDGTYLAAGSAFGYDSQNRITQDGWFVRFDENGCIGTDCEDVSIEPKLSVKSQMDIYPNPNNGVFILSNKELFPNNTQVVLMDLSGKRIMDLPSPQRKLKQDYDLSELRSGTYFLQIIQDETIEYLRIIKM